MNQLDAFGGDQEATVCYLCLDGGSEAGQPLRRDCACRGTDAGFVHLACLTDYAATKSKQAQDMIEFRGPWRECPGCHQCYQNKLGIDIAAKFVLWVRRKYPDDTQMKVEAHYLKLCALDNMLERLQPVQKREVGVTADVILALIEWMNGGALPLSMRYSQVKASAHGVHGRIALNEGTEESARRAVAHFEKCLEVSKATGDTDGIAATISNIAYAKSMYEGGNNNDELLKTSRELYELRVASFGEEHGYTIIAGKDYAVDLQKVDRGDEARELLTKLLAASKRILGSHHNITKEIESELE